MPEDKRLSYKEAAAYLGIAERTFYNKVKQGIIPKHRATIGTGRGGRRVYFLKSELKAIKADMLQPQPNK
jgi:excisionase family DNA binding protein